MAPQYQTFPGVPGDSNSMVKLASLALPPLAGKSFLDIGCNEGFFCGYAFFDAAKKVVGIDKDPEFIARARRNFPQCVFEECDWVEYARDRLACSPFDVILCSSALHYAENPAELVELLMRGLNRNGLLVLELGVATHGSSDWLTVERDMDERMFPTWNGLDALLKPYVWKVYGESVPQKGDPLKRYVLHIQNPMPYAVLLMGVAGSGKSTVAKRVFPDWPCIMGDSVWNMVLQSPDRFPELQGLTIGKVNWQRLDVLYRNMFDGNAWREYVRAVVEAAAGRDFVFDGFIPPDGRERFTNALRECGYQILSVDTGSPEYSLNFLSRRAREETRKYELFLAPYMAMHKKRG